MVRGGVKDSATKDPRRVARRSSIGCGKCAEGGKTGPTWAQPASHRPASPHQPIPQSPARMSENIARQVLVLDNAFELHLDVSGVDHDVFCRRLGTLERDLVQNPLHDGV